MSLYCSSVVVVLQVREIYLEEGSKEEVPQFSLQSLWTQIAPLFKPPLLWRTLLLYYLTFVIYIAYVTFTDNIIFFVLTRPSS